MSSDIPTPDEARAALAQSDAARRKMAADYTFPPTRHFFAGLLFAIPPTLPIVQEPFGLVGGIAYVLGAVLLIAWDRRRDGLSITAPNILKPSGAFALACGMAMIGLIVLQRELFHAGVDYWLHYVVIATAFLLGVSGSAGWLRLFRRELGADN